MPNVLSFLLNVDGFTFNVSSFMLNVDSFTFNVSSFMLNVDSFTPNVSSFMLNVDGFTLNISSFMLNVDGFTLNVSSFMLNVDDSTLNVPSFAFNIGGSMLEVYDLIFSFLLIKSQSCNSTWSFLTVRIAQVLNIPAYCLNIPTHCQPSNLHKTCLGLSGGRGFAKAWTGSELPKSCEVSHETTPRLTPNPSLSAGIYVFKMSISHFFYNTLYRELFHD